MAKAHPIELRERVVAHVEEGPTHRSTAEHFRVSIKSVNDMVKLKHETGSLAAKPAGNRRGSGKLEPYKDWVRSCIEENGDITTMQLSLGLKEAFDLDVHAWSVSRLLHRLGLSHKKRHFTPKSNSAPM